MRKDSKEAGVDTWGRTHQAEEALEQRLEGGSRSGMSEEDLMYPNSLVVIIFPCS